MEAYTTIDFCKKVKEERMIEMRTEIKAQNAFLITKLYISSLKHHARNELQK